LLSSETWPQALDLYQEAMGVLEEVRAGYVRALDRLRLTGRTLHVYMDGSALAIEHGLTEHAYGYLLGSHAREVRAELGHGADQVHISLSTADLARLRGLLACARQLEQALCGPDWPRFSD
jgi:hypothetical protein